MQDDHEEREPRRTDPADMPPEQVDAVEEERSAEEFETVPPGAPSVENGPGGSPWSAEGADESSADRPPWPAADAAPADGPPDEGTGDRAADQGAVAGPPPSEAEAYPPPAASERSAETAAHSVPATSVGESTQCPRCGTENRPGVAFCRNCGQRLVAAGVAPTVQRPGVPEGTQQCPRCGTHNRAGVAFCQNCGANLRVAASPAPGYVPPPAAATAGTARTDVRDEPRGGALLGPIVLLIGAIGLITAYLLPFANGSASLWDRSYGAPGGYGVGFWDGFSGTAGGLAGQLYFGLAAAAPLLVLLLVVLAVAGFLRAAPGGLQGAGLVIALLWALGLAVLFVVVEVAGAWSGDAVAVLRNLSPGGIIFFLASLIVIIGGLTRLSRS